jgi:hypothetical protein
MKIERVTNLEYDFLFNEGGDGLIAFFATIRNAKHTAVMRRVGKKGPKALIRYYTGLSRATIEKHFPHLETLDLVEVHLNGNLAIRGRKWTDKHLPRLYSRKTIPIEICNKFTDTKDSVRFVRVHSNYEKQISQIGKKAVQIEILRESIRNETRTNHDYHVAKQLVKNGLTVESLTQSCLNSTISNLGFYKLLENSDEASQNNRRKGHYFKNKLIKRNLIAQDRQVRRVSRFKSKEALDTLSENEKYGGFFMGSSGIYYESSPRIELGNSPLVGNKKKQVER